MKAGYICASFFFGLMGALFGHEEQALAVNINVSNGWPCNVFLQHLGDSDALGNTADFNAKETPLGGTMSYSFITGEDASYIPITSFHEARIENLPVLEPLNFNLRSENFGAKVGVDVCIPAVSTTRDDVLTWTIKAYGVGGLLPPDRGDWFLQSNPKIAMTFLASNCNRTLDSNMVTSTSSTTPVKVGSCEITPFTGNDLLSVFGPAVQYEFKLMASRQAVLRFTVSEQSITRRGVGLDSGVVQIELSPSDLPPLLLGDLLQKQLFFKPDDLQPGCDNFLNRNGIAFDKMDLQGAENRLVLNWKGVDNDDVCTGAIGPCVVGDNKGGPFSVPVSVILEGGVPLGIDASANQKVESFAAVYVDQAESQESVFPRNGRIDFNFLVDKVYRDPVSNTTFFSTTVSRETIENEWRTCRVWFKRSPSFNCNSLPEEPTIPNLKSLCQNAISNGNQLPNP